MTGYGNARAAGNDFSVEVEIQSYNHRFLDAKVSLPTEYLATEPEITKQVAERVVRGRINIFVTIHHGSGHSSVKIDEPLARKYWLALNRLRKKLSIREELDPGSLLHLPGVFSVDSVQPSTREFRDCLMVALNSALDKLIKMRQREGSKLRADLSRHVHALKKSLRLIQERVRVVPAGASEDRDRKEKPLGPQTGGGESDAAPSIQEELARLQSHIEQFENMLDRKEPTGKILDFISLEMHRETTTLGDKADDILISQQTVLMKSAIENLREQVRNVE